MTFTIDFTDNRKPERIISLGPPRGAWKGQHSGGFKKTAS
jgi:hypothetical protein